MKVILLILTICAAAAFHAPQLVLIKAGQEVDRLRLQYSPVQTAIVKYGKNTDFTQGIACGDHDYYTNRFTFSKQGITVISETVDNEDEKMASITKIGVSYPCNAETEQGISLLRDNSDKVIKAYGEPEKVESSKSFVDIHYTSKGISFRCDRAKKNILKIEIYLSGTNADFWY
jgi:hypothetical protein